MARVLRWLFILLGFLSLLLGGLGAILPLLPTTPFVLVAAYFFSKGSPRFYYWLLSLPHLGECVRSWNEHGVIGRRPKVVAVASLLGVSILMGFRPLPLKLKLSIFTIFAGIIAFIVSRPETPRSLHSTTSKRPGP